MKEINIEENIHDLIKKAEIKRDNLISVFKTKYPNNRYASNTDKLKQYIDYNRLSLFLKQIEILKTAGVLHHKMDIADVGSYFPYFIYMLKNNLKINANYTAYDFNLDALEFGKSFSEDLTIKTNDLFSDNYKPSIKYDLIILSQVIEHFVDPVSMTKKILQSLKYNGHLFISVPNGRYDSLYLGNKINESVYDGHVNFWSLISFNTFIKSLGQNVRNIESGFIGDKNIYAILASN